jgi:hypothetical protein
MSAHATIVIQVGHSDAEGYAQRPGKDAKMEGEINWISHTNPLGFTVLHPPGWHVEAESIEHIVIASADRSVFAFVHPFLLPQPTAALTWLQQAPGLFPTHFPQARLLHARTYCNIPDEAVGALTFAGVNGIGRANVLCSLHQRSGMFYAVTAPQAQFAAWLPTLIGILNTFRFIGPSVRPNADTLHFVRWTDPREYAFSLEVPEGWQIEGGMFRGGVVDTRPAVELTSPDRQVRVTYGDAGIPPFTEPNPMLSFAGMNEGSWYSPGYATKMMVWRYLTGAQYARMHVETKVAAATTRLRFTEVRDRPDVSQILNAPHANFAALVNIQVSAGEAAFTCDYAGQPLQGYYLAATQRMDMGLGAGWSVTQLYGYIATPERTLQAQDVLMRMLQTFTFDLNWQAMQSRSAVTTSNIVTQANNDISRMINDSYWRRQAVLDDINRKWSNVILGKTDVIDPVTGETWKVTSGANYYWRNAGTNTIVGTDVYDRPNINFEPLKEW